MVCFIPSATYHSSIFILTGHIMELTYFVDMIATFLIKRNVNKRNFHVQFS